MYLISRQNYYTKFLYKIKGLFLFQKQKIRDLYQKKKSANCYVYYQEKKEHENKGFQRSVKKWQNKATQKHKASL